MSWVCLTPTPPKTERNPLALRSSLFNRSNLLQLSINAENTFKTYLLIDVSTQQTLIWRTPCAEDIGIEVMDRNRVDVVLVFTVVFFFFFSCFSGPHLWQMEVRRLEVESEL